MTGFDTEHARDDIAEARDLIVAMAVRLPLKYRDHEPTLVLFDELAALRERVAALQAQLEALEYELYTLRVMAALADGHGDSAPGCPVAATRRYLEARGITPHQITADLGKYEAVLASRGVREPEQETT